MHEPKAYVLSVTWLLLDTAMSPTPITTRWAKMEAMVGEAMRQEPGAGGGFPKKGGKRQNMRKRWDDGSPD